MILETVARRGAVLLMILCAAHFFVACASSVDSAAADKPSLITAPTEEPLLAADFSMIALDGDNVTLSELRGKWVLVNFWATWCAPCIDEMPALQLFADSHADQAVVLGVNMREETGAVADFLTRVGVTYPILLSPNDETLLAYQVYGLPTTWLIAPDGTAVFNRPGVVDVEQLAEIVAAR